MELGWLGSEAKKQMVGGHGLSYLSEGGESSSSSHISLSVLALQSVSVFLDVS